MNIERREDMTGWIIAIVIVGGLGIAGWNGWSKLMKEHKEAKNLPIKDIDFKSVKNGTYKGNYAGGMYKWRANECEAKVESGKVLSIKLTSTIDPAKQNMQVDELYKRVIDKQSLQVDTISTATLTSKAYLKAVENALLQGLPES